MMTELQNSIGNEVLTGLGQAAGAIALCAAVVLLCRWHAVRVEREAAVSLARGLVQMVLVGMILALLLHGTVLVGSLILLMMVVAAAATAAASPPKNGRCAAAVFLVDCRRRGSRHHCDARDPEPPARHFHARARGQHDHCQCDERVCTGHRALPGRNPRPCRSDRSRTSLGAEPAVAVAPYLQSAVYASLLPRLDMLKSLGLVWIPGVMAGMVVSGTSPVYAAIYQFIVVAMILAASGITGLIATVLMRSRAFSPAAQLAIRPEAPASSRQSRPAAGRRT